MVRRKNAKGNIMTTRTTLSAIGNFFEVVRSAAAVSNSVSNNRQPAASHLRTLGIDPIEFRKIRQF